ncbi:MAG: metal ABC transporter permease [Candidatus Margulisiibacteriota bacterium]
MTSLMTMLGFPFFQHAILAGILISIALGIVGTYVVVKRISFIAGSVAHAAFGGVGMGYYFGVNPLISAMGFGVICAWMMGVIRHWFSQDEDALIGAIWAVGMAVGIFFIFLTPTIASDLFGYLFGNILLISTQDLWLLLALDGLILAVTMVLYRVLQAVTFDEEFSTVINVPVLVVNLILLTLIALTAVLLIRAVGIILVIALLTMPSAAAKNWCNSLKSMQIVSVMIAMASTTAGITLGYVYNVPASPVIIFGVAGLYILSLFKFRRFKLHSEVQ